MAAAATSPDTPLGELIAALSLACDLGNNFPLEKGLRNTLLATRLAKAVGLSGEHLSDVYYVSLLRFIGCPAFAVETARRFGDDNALRGAMAPVDFADNRGTDYYAASEWLAQRLETKLGELPGRHVPYLTDPAQMAKALKALIDSRE